MMIKSGFNFFRLNGNGGWFDGVRNIFESNMKEKKIFGVVRGLIL